MSRAKNISAILLARGIGSKKDGRYFSEWSRLNRMSARQLRRLQLQLSQKGEDRHQGVLVERRRRAETEANLRQKILYRHGEVLSRRCEPTSFRALVAAMQKQQGELTA